MTEHIPALPSSTSTSAPPSVAHGPIETSVTLVPQFALGQVVDTPGALALLNERGVNGITLLQRHVNGDWGSICAAGTASNEEALKYGSRLLSQLPITGWRRYLVHHRGRPVVHHPAHALGVLGRG